MNQSYCSRFTKSFRILQEFVRLFQTTVSKRILQCRVIVLLLVMLSFQALFAFRDKSGPITAERTLLQNNYSPRNYANIVIGQVTISESETLEGVSVKQNIQTEMSGSDFIQNQPKVNDTLPEVKSNIPAERAGNTDWFKTAGWGVFTHFLYKVQCAGKRINTMDGVDDWDACVNEFNTEKFAEQIQSAGASYVIFTMMQRTRHLIAPNKTFDKITGYKPGEACSKRDLVEDLYTSLHKRGIKLMLYWTGDGPRDDEKAAKAMGYTEQVSDHYVQQWADVAAEYGERYKDKVAGWWTDGCYEYIGYNKKKWAIMAKGLRAGNAKRIIALNNPKMTRSNSSTPEDDYTTGEQNQFGEIPLSRWRDGVQWHILSYLGDEWCAPGLRFTPDFMSDYIRKCNAVGGVVSIDVCLFRDGTIETSHLECLRGINRRLKNK